VPEVYLESRLDYLRNTQNADGAWGYFPGKGSWMEPTTYAILALYGTPGSEVPISRAWSRIRSWRLADGSYRAGAEVKDGTWVTAHAVTLATVLGKPDASTRDSVNWLLKVRGEEGSVAKEILSYFHLLKTTLDFSHTGWPWHAGNSSWIEPTAHTLVALKKISKTYMNTDLRRRVADGELMILTRRSSDGGWNCGNPNVLNFDLPSYPETTGLALLGLQGRTEKDLAGPLDFAAKLRAETKSSLAKAWLGIALRNFGRLVPAPDNPLPPSGDIMLSALEAVNHPDGNFRLFHTGAIA
jgi:prenyltransferase/squalene oxidase-like repeat protein